MPRKPRRPIVVTSNLEPRTGILPWEREILIPMTLEALRRSGILEQPPKGESAPIPESNNQKPPKHKG